MKPKHIPPRGQESKWQPLKGMFMTSYQGGFGVHWWLLQQFCAFLSEFLEPVSVILQEKCMKGAE